MRDCTFAPCINERSRRMAAEWSRAALAQSAAQHRERLQMERHRREFQECTFMPKINQYSPTGNSRLRNNADMAVEDRLYGYAREYAEKRKALEENIFTQRTTRAAGDEKQRAEEEAHRRATDAKAQKYREKVRNGTLQFTKTLQSSQQIEDDKCTFNPQLNPRSLEIARRLPESYEQRMAVYNMRKQEKMQKLAGEGPQATAQLLTDEQVQERCDKLFSNAGRIRQQLFVEEQKRK